MWSSWWVHLGTHAILASGYVAYGFYAKIAEPAHALVVMFCATAIALLLTNGKRIATTAKGTAKGIAWFSGALYALYFFLLLYGMRDVDPSSAALIMSLSICANASLTIYAKHRKIEAPLILFAVAILLVVYLIEQRGQPSIAHFTFPIFLLLCVICEGANAYIRLIWCAKLNIPAGPVAEAGMVLALAPSLLFALIAIGAAGLDQTLSALEKYGIGVYGSWVYLGLIPTLAAVTLLPRCESAAALRFHSLAGAKPLMAALLMLIFASQRQNSLLYSPTLLQIILFALLLLLIYLYNSQDATLSELKALKGRAGGAT